MTLLTAEQAAKLLTLGTSTINRYSLQGRIPSIKIGKRRVFDKETLEQWVKEQEEK